MRFSADCCSENPITQGWEWVQWFYRGGLFLTPATNFFSYSYFSSVMHCLFNHFSYFWLFRGGALLLHVFFSLQAPLQKDMAMVKSFFRPQVDLGLSAVKSQFSFSNMCNCAVTELQKPHQKILIGGKKVRFSLKKTYNVVLRMCFPIQDNIWVICYCWGNSSILEGRFSKWF